MATTSNIVSTLGAGSGIDTKALAESLVAAERAPRQERIETKKTETEARISAYGAIKYALSELKTAFEAINDANELGSLQVSNSQSSAVTVKASSSATTGNFDFEVLQLASAQRSASSSFAAVNTPLNGGTAFSLNLSINGGAAQAIAVSTATPTGMVDAINNADLGVSARLVQTDSAGSAWSIVVTGESGADQAFTLTSSDSSANPVAGVEFATTLQSASQAIVKIDGLTVNRASNTIDDLVQGVTFELGATTNGAAHLGVTRETASLKEKLQTLVSAYNGFNETLQELTNPKSEVETVGGALAADSLVQNLRAQVRKLVTNTSETPGTHIRAARDMGLSLDRYGALQLDETKLDTALSSHFDEVVTMFTADSNGLSVYSDQPSGLAGQAVSRLDEMLRSTGIVNQQITTAQSRVKDYEEELTALEDRMAQLLERYTSQFSTMDTLVGNANAMRTSLSSSFEGLMAMYTNK